jgi:methionine-rich copper-binding protein CopC
MQSLLVLLDSAPEVLFASGEAPSRDHYSLHWQARSSADGTVSKGDIPFSVAP